MFGIPKDPAGQKKFLLGVLPLLLTGPMRAAAERWVRTAQ